MPSSTAPTSPIKTHTMAAVPAPLLPPPVALELVPLLLLPSAAAGAVAVAEASILSRPFGPRAVLGRSDEEIVKSTDGRKKSVRGSVV